MQPAQLREFRLVAETQGRPALAQDEAVRVFRDLPQRLDVARVLRPVNSGGQLVIRLQLVGLVGKAVGVNLKTAFFTDEHETCEDLAVSRRPSALHDTPRRLDFADGRWPVIKRGTHGQLMRVGGAYYGMVLRQMESSGDEVEEVRR